jgi:cation-transporting ATPase 13A1
MSPAQKEEVVTALNSSGLHTLMCGDGTNDVGALKAAHVGVSIINDPRFERLIEASASSSSSSSSAAAAVGAGGKKPKGSSQKERMARAMKELEAQEQDPTIVKLGDASIASPFTARRTSIDSVLTVVRQGRCTLVTTTQVFKILALNCLVSAYMMSALYLIGLKQGDMQMTASGLVTAGLFFFLSQAKPLAQLAPARPPSSVFAASISVSIVGQFVIHLASLWATLRLCQQYISPDDSTLAMDGKFQPNVINSAMFLLSVAMQINNFVVNYRGHPFTQSIQDNYLLWRSVQAIYLALLVLAGGQFEPLNDLLQMAPFPSANFQGYLLLILLANFSLSYTVEILSRRLE